MSIADKLLRGGMKDIDAGHDMEYVTKSIMRGNTYLALAADTPELSEAELQATILVTLGRYSQKKQVVKAKPVSTGELYITRDTNQPGVFYFGRVATQTVDASLQQNNRMSLNNTWAVLYSSGQVEEPVSLEATVMKQFAGHRLSGKWFSDACLFDLVQSIEANKTMYVKPAPVVATAQPVKPFTPDPTKVIPAIPDKINLDRLKEVLNYNHITGEFTWVKRKNRGSHVGDVAGTINKSGKRYIGIDNKSHSASLLAWAWMKRGEPVGKIKHHGNRANDAINNLYDSGVTQ